MEPGDKRSLVRVGGEGPAGSSRDSRALCLPPVFTELSYLGQVMLTSLSLSFLIYKMGRKWQFIVLGVLKRDSVTACYHI